MVPDYLAPHCPWAGFEPATITFCEERLCSWVVEPSNAWSNLAFVLVGIYLVWRSRRFALPISLALGWLAILEGIGSFFFHASGVFVGEVADVGCMYLISALFICIALKRLTNAAASNLTIAYVCMSSTSTLALIIFRDLGIALFALQIAVAVVLEFRLFRRHRQGVDYRFLMAMATTFVLAFTLWTLDVTQVLCDPKNHLFTGHAAWHCLNALCLYFYGRFIEQFERTGDWFQARSQ